MHGNFRDNQLIQISRHLCMRSRLVTSKVTPDAMMHEPKAPQPERPHESRYGLRGMRSTTDVEAFSSRSQKIVNRPRVEIKSLSDHLSTAD
jgi:hypothetical protein